MGSQRTALAEIVGLVELARQRAARAINATMSAVYWSIGRRIVLEEQRGTPRAEYGEELVEQLAVRLTAKFGRVFGRANLWQICDGQGMRDTLVLTIIGPDRTGLVESVSDRIAAVGGNWEESRMARLAGQFAGILLVTVEAVRTDQLVASLRTLEGAGLQVTVRPTAPATPASGTHVRLEVDGQDRPGIVRDVSRVLAERGINVEELESEVASGAMSGEHMFHARARLFAPAGADLGELRTSLERLAGELMVDLSVE